MILHTHRLTLRPVTPGDATAIFEYSGNPQVGESAGWKPHADIRETRQVMDAIFIGKEHIFGIVLKENSTLIGTIGLVGDPKRANPKAMMLGYAMGEPYWGKGYMTEAAGAVVRYGFDKLALRLISAYCYPHNSRSKRVVEKCEFTFEGTLRRAEVRYDGAVLDNDCYAIIK